MPSKFHRSIGHELTDTQAIDHRITVSDDPLMWPEKPDEPDDVRQRREERDALCDRATVAVRYRAFKALKNKLLEAHVCLACGRQCKPHEPCQCENDE